MRYFYELGEFRDLIPEGQERAPWNHCGWDARTWQRSRVLKEQTKEQYEKMLVLEAEIAEQKKQIGLKDTSHHRPMKLTNSQLKAALEYLHFTIKE